MVRLRFLIALPLLALLPLGCGGSSHQPDAGAAPPWGSECGSGTGCSDGLACIDDDRFPGGYCSATCDAEPCGPGAECTDDYGVSLCFGSCVDDADCRSDHQCWRGLCRPACTSDAQCGGDGAVCEDGTCGGAECTEDTDCAEAQRCSGGRCIAAPTDGGTDLPVGRPCTASTECASGICLPESMGGTCARSCVDTDDCGSFDRLCAPASIDTDGDGSADSVAAACVERNPDGNFLAGRCSSASQCASRACVRRQCAEVCDDDGDCLIGQVCREVDHPDVDGGTYRGCWYEDRSGGTVVEDVPLGDIDVVAGGAGHRINFAVPDDAVSLTIIGRRTGGDNPQLTFVDLFAPDNEQLFDLVEISSFVDQPIRWLPLRSHESIAMLVPNSTSDRVRFLPGRYGVSAGALSESADDSRRASVELFARVKRGSPGTTLDLNVHLVGVGISAAEAPSHSRLQSTLDELDRILGGVGIDVGAVDYFEVGTSGLAVIDSSDGPDSEMAQLLRMSGGRSNMALDVFLVRGISESAGESGGIALGIAGGVPGPPGVHGTMHSGVLVSFDTSVVGSDHRIPAQIAAHEIGHYLGLFHNTEGTRPCGPGEEPTESDPCAPFDGGDVLSDTSYGDGRNLMYYALGGSDGSTYNIRLSDGQGFVMTRSALVR